MPCSSPVWDTHAPYFPDFVFNSLPVLDLIPQPLEGEVYPTTSNLEVAWRELAENMPNLIHEGGDGIVIVARKLDLIQVP